MFWYKRPNDAERPTKRLGRIHVYTGEGKGKTTAALGVALRSLGAGLSVVMIQFLKGHKDYGELQAQQQYLPEDFEIVQFGTPEKTNLVNPSAIDRYLAQQGFDYARRRVAGPRPNVLILDEMNLVLHHGLIATEDVLDFLDNKHQELEVIFTGRDAPAALLNAADIVTVMQKVKQPHDYDDEEFFPRRGIEH